MRDASVYLRRMIVDDYGRESFIKIVRQLREAATPEMVLLIIDRVQPFLLETAVWIFADFSNSLDCSIRLVRPIRARAFRGHPSQSPLNHCWQIWTRRSDRIYWRLSGERCIQYTLAHPPCKIYYSDSSRFADMNLCRCTLVLTAKSAR